MAQRLGRDRRAVADAAAQDDDVVGAPHRDLAAQQRDHAPTPRVSARATAARSWRGRSRPRARRRRDRGAARSARPSSALTIRATWSLLGAPVAADRALDLLRRVADARQRRAGRPPASPTPRACPTANAVLHVLAEVQLLERHRVGLVLGDQRLERRRGCRPDGAPRASSARGLDHAAVERDQAPAAARDDAVAGVRQAGVDAEDDHERVILRPRSDACPAAAYAVAYADALR